MVNPISTVDTTKKLAEIAVAEKYRPIYEKQALINKQLAIQKANLENPKHDVKDSILPYVVKTNPVDTTKKLAEIAGVGKETYRIGSKVLNSSRINTKKCNIPKIGLINKQ